MIITCFKKGGIYSPFFLFVILIFLSYNVKGQYVIDGRGSLKLNDTITVLKYMVVNGDTIPFKQLNTQTIYSLRKFDSRKDQKKYDRLLALTISVYPLAQKAVEKLQYNEYLLNTMSKKERKQWMKKLERDLDAEFSGKLKKLSSSQGIVLLKLIDRGTNKTGFMIARELKGSFRAFFWNAIARSFGLNLKTEFKPDENEEDKYIEEFCKMIELGIIEIPAKYNQ
jgi:hypothetical protein